MQASDDLELIIDTSTRYASVGVSLNGELQASISWRSARNHSVELVPAVREVMARTRASMDDLTAIFIANGPGGFSALRVGMSTAKMLAVSLHVPLVAVGTLDAEVALYIGLVPVVLGVIGAGKGRFYVGTYSDSMSESDQQVMSHDEFVTSLAGDYLICGEASVEARDLVLEKTGDSVKAIGSPPPTRSSAVMAKIGFDKLSSGMVDDPITLEPLYLRSSQINTASKRWATSK